MSISEIWCHLYRADLTMSAFFDFESLQSLYLTISRSPRVNNTLETFCTSVIDPQKSSFSSTNEGSSPLQPPNHTISAFFAYQSSERLSSIIFGNSRANNSLEILRASVIDPKISQFHLHSKD